MNTGLARAALITATIAVLSLAAATPEPVEPQPAAAPCSCEIARGETRNERKFRLRLLPQHERPVRPMLA